jgi:anti-sigma factor RsiW
MTCDRMKDTVLDLLYGELEPRAREEAEEHLRTCPDCREEVESLRRVRRVLDEGRPTVPEAPPIQVALPPRVARGPLWAAAAAFLLAALLSVLALGRATMSWDESGFSLAFGAASGAEDALLEAARSEAQAAARRVVDDRLASHTGFGPELDERDDRLYRQISDRQARWEEEREQNLERYLQDVRQETRRARSLMEYTLLASQAPQVLEH